MDVLKLTRLCAWYMNEMTKDLGLGNTAIHWSGEDPTQWMVVDATWVKAVDGKDLVAEIRLRTTTQVEIVVPDNYRLIRNEHLAEYDPHVYGIRTNENPDFKGDTDPDLIINYTLDDEPILLQGPRQYLPQRSFARKPTLRRAYEP